VLRPAHPLERAASRTQRRARRLASGCRAFRRFCQFRSPRFSYRAITETPAVAFRCGPCRMAVTTMSA